MSNYSYTVVQHLVSCFHCCDREHKAEPGQERQEEEKKEGGSEGEQLLTCLRAETERKGERDRERKALI